MNSNMEQARHFHIIIIGGGPIGMACALEAEKKGLDYVVLEKGTLVNSLYHYPDNMTFFSSSERLELDEIPFISIHAKPNRNEALEYYRRIADARQLNIRLFERVQGMERDSNGLFCVTTDKQMYTCRHTIIATGFYDLPYLLNVPGEELPKVRHFYKDPHYYAFRKVVVIGAMNSAVDAALETWRKGAEVTMVVRGPEIGERVKYWVRPDIENRIKEGSIKAYFNAHVVQITPTEVIIQTPTGPVTIDNDEVLAMTGYQPNIRMLADAGIRLSQDGVFKPEYDEATYETNISGLYVAGVVCGGMDTHSYFIENSRQHAVQIMADISQKGK